jgi:coenzyme F420-0:L-glutamate ligase/coenzyme F420-1:gamma-L-glutamate ligase
VTRGSSRAKGRAKAGPAQQGILAFHSVPAALRSRVLAARVARLVTVGGEGVGAGGGPHAVPVCFVCYRGLFYSAIDRKPKSVAPEKLARLRNIARRPQVALLIDHYEEDWAKLWFVLIRGKARRVQGSARREREAVMRALRKKYPQYVAGMLADDAPLIRIAPQRVFAWGTF